jgi:ATP-dependent dihydroxyacetone kinase
MKKLINDPKRVEREMLEGLVDLHANLALLDSEDVVIRADLPAPPRRQVAVLSGGGSGHEPAHAGYVGTGMLSGAIAGAVFTSPSVDAVLNAIRASAGPAGAVLVVKNYTGDRLNFGLAAALATAEGIPTRVVVVADDVALHDTVERARWRGIAGTVLVHKVAGAAAMAGADIDQVASEAAATAAALGTMGVALSACTVPAAGKSGFSLGDNEMELGLGIHGEPGVRRGPLEPADRIVEAIIETLLAQTAIPESRRVALLINGLGGTPPMELAIIARHALATLKARGLMVERAWAGNFMTALEMPGCSLSLLALDDIRLSRLDANTDAPAWPGRGQIGLRKIVTVSANPPAPDHAVAAIPSGAEVRAAALAVAAAMERNEAHLTELDARAGDGDLGISMARGAAAIRALPDTAWRTPGFAFARMAEALRRSIAGSSGPFYATALLRAAEVLGNDAPSAADWARAFAAAVDSIAELGGAKPGDRTMLDALKPACDAFARAVAEGKTLPGSWAQAVAAAEAGTAATANMRPRLGRAAYLGERALGIPDAGASAVVVWMQALARP